MLSVLSFPRDEMRRIGFLVQAVTRREAQICELIEFLMVEHNKIAHHVRDQVILCATLETERQEFQALFRCLESVSG
jgi:hypothetical protein